MSTTKIVLNQTQIDFLCSMLEVEETSEAIKKFAKIMNEEGLSSKDMGAVLNLSLKAWKKKHG